MLFFPNCKINIGLRVVARRADGYHDIETWMVPVRGLCDIVEIVHAPGDRSRVRLLGARRRSSSREKSLPACLSCAARALSDRGRTHPFAQDRAHGSRFGGGSADAAFVVKGSSELFGLNLSRKCMEELCAGIGSDTAFFVANRPALATGRGEILEPVELLVEREALADREAGRVRLDGRGLCRYRAAPYGPSVARVSERSCWPVAGDGAQRFRACRVPRSSAAGAAPQRDVSPGGRLCFDDRFRSGRIRNIRRRHADRFRFRRCICLSGRYGLIARRVDRADFRIWQKKRKFASGYVFTAFET